jgi:branched-chain amino acid transport system substrate-binding protein
MRDAVISLCRTICQAIAASALLAAPALANEHRIGLSAPLSDDFSLLGEQMRDGAVIAAEAASLELVVEDDGCTAEGGARAARNLVGREVSIAVGFLCTEAIEAALPILGAAGIPVISSGVRSGGLTDRRAREGWLVWRVIPRADAELAAVADILVPQWRSELFAIVDDGTIHGRELAESLRLGAELAALQPVFVDTYRPQMENQIGLVGRLRRAGATHVFVGGDRDDIAIIARDAAELDHDLTIAGGEALRAEGDIPLPAGVLMIGVPEWADMLDEGTIEPFAEAGIVPEGYVATTHAAVEVAAQALDAAGGEPAAMRQALDQGQFETLIGTLSFDEKGDRRGSPYRLLRFDGERFLPAD